MSAPVKRHHHVIYKRSWHLLVAFGLIVLPVLFFIAFSKYTHIAINNLFSDISVSIGRIFAAFVISIVAGWVLAVLFYRGKASVVALPLFDVLQSVPTFAALPIAVLYWGPGTGTVIFFLILAMLWPILFSVISSLKLIKSQYEEAVTLYQLRGWRRIRYFLFPATIPGLITGAIIGLGEAWEAVIATEIIIGVHSGLGPFFKQFSTSPRITAFGMLGILMIIFAINRIFLLPLLERSHSLMDE